MPLPRSYHVMVRLRDTVVVGTGWSAEHGFTSDWWKFDSIDQTWTKLAVVGDAHRPSSRCVGHELYNATHSIVGLGLGARVYSDWFFVTLEASAAGGLTVLRATKIPMTNNIAIGERGIIRAYASLSVFTNYADSFGRFIIAATVR